MKKFIIMILSCLNIFFAFGQNTLRVIIKDGESNEALVGATAKIKGSTIGSASNIDGQLEINNIPDGEHILEFSYVGYEKLEKTFQFPLADSLQGYTIYLIPKHHELEEIVVSTTRTSRSIANIPTRVEIIELEEIDEKSNMKPSNVSTLLRESTGIHVQQTSATSANASIRIQGLDGRYTQILKDGYPNYGNFASSLSILEIPPLDLKQVEIIKGSSSTLYGGGAIAGVVNFISKTPENNPENTILFNQSHVGQTNFGFFTATKKAKIGYTFLATSNYQKAYDVDNDDFSELPKSNDFTINPKLYFYFSDRATFILGNNFTTGNRKGGDMQVIKNKADSVHSYFETNKNIRNVTLAEFIFKTSETNNLIIRSSATIYNRQIDEPNYLFKGKNFNNFNEITHTVNKDNQTFILGINYITDNFKDVQNKYNMTTSTIGIFGQHTIDITKQVKIESGCRFDMVRYVSNQNANRENFILPRISGLFVLSEHLTSRIGFGYGYKTPTLFTEETEMLHYKNIRPIENVSSEKSRGITTDFNFKIPITKDLFFSMNQLFFYTTINNPTHLQIDTSGFKYFINETKPIVSRGTETNLKFVFKEHVKFFMGYTYTDATAKYKMNNQTLHLLPKNKINLVLIYEEERNIKIGIEGYFTDKQILSDGSPTHPYWIFGAMAEKTWNKLSVYINFENFTNTRQSKYKPVVNGPHNNPSFDEIWTSTEGFIFNGGIKIKF